MTATAVVEIVKWLAEIVKTVVDVVGVALSGPEPPALDALRAKVVAAIEARHKDWMAAAKKEADAEFTKAANEAHGGDGTP